VLRGAAGAAGAGVGLAVVGGTITPAAAALPDSVFYNADTFGPGEDPENMPPYLHPALGFDPDVEQKAGITLGAPASWSDVDVYAIGAIDNSSGLHDGQVARLQLSSEDEVDFTVGAADTWQGFREQLNPTHDTAFGAVGASNWQIAPFGLRRLATDVADTLDGVFYVWGLELVESP
jgi:hypothetical protein